MNINDLTNKLHRDLTSQVFTILKKSIPVTAQEIADQVGCSPDKATEIVRGMMAHGLLVTEQDGHFHFVATIQPGGKATVQLADRGDGWMVFGCTSDNHLASKHYRHDVLHTLYDIYAEEGVQHVFNSGNWIEGEARFNRHDIAVFGMSAQVDFFLNEYPQRKGIKTHYVAGDDHEGWYVQRELADIGQYVEDRAKANGRFDLNYLGYMEADVELRQPEGSAVLRVQHGGGGSAYALSYTLQKMVEAMQGGEKPTVLSLGHHHKFCYAYPRNVHAFMPGCTQDQSMFMRKNKIEAHVGGCLIWLKQNKQGIITRFRCEWIPFYDRGFYERRFAITA